MHRLGQNRTNTPYMTVYLVISLPKIPYIHRIYIILANPAHAVCFSLHSISQNHPPCQSYPILLLHRVGQNRINTPYMTIFLVISLPKIPYIHRIVYGSGQPYYCMLKFRGVAAPMAHPNKGLSVPMTLRDH
jgi:hypothetical protein